MKKILIYGFVILVVLAFLKNGCSFNSTIERDGTGSDARQEQTGVLNESLYDACIRATEENIDQLLAQTPIDSSAVRGEYEFLITCLASEYMFKTMAYGHFTGNYEPQKYDSIVQEKNRVVEEMKEYFDSETVESLQTAIVVRAYEDFEDGMFDYDSGLIGTQESPNIDAMWEVYFEALVNTSG